ncbi:MAG: hypothetical protein FWG10_02495 [Eubacteriaceae bacterium]|nr:hypothetical protein [Eubacteriaceae bacterium]
MDNERSLRKRRLKDEREFRRILRMGDDNLKSFYNLRGCGLEIEFGINYSKESSRYIKTGLEKMVNVVGDKGKFVPDITISSDFNVEIVLLPMTKEELKPLFLKICEILDFYDDFVFSDKCGLHATFLANDEEKKLFFDLMADGGYNQDFFDHNKYKVSFSELIKMTPDGSIMSYEDYLAYQNEIWGKYTSINFLKPDLVEFRSLKLSWEQIEYVYNAFESVYRWGDKNPLLETAHSAIVV